MGIWKAVVVGMLLLAGAGAVAQERGALGSRLPLSPGPAVAPAPPPPVTGPGGAKPLAKGDVDAWLDGYLPYALRAADIPGAVVVVVKDGQVLTARGFGYADLARRTPVDPDRTLFRLGSVSKLFTWTAVMQLVEQGRLDLDADINRYLDFRIPPYRGQPITLRQVMTHTAGFEEAAKGLIGTDPARNPSLEAYLKRWTPTRIFAPGTTPAYSNWATTLAGYVVQRAGGEPFDDYLDHHVFAPLGMRNATFRQPLPAALAPQMATAYAKPGQAGPFEFVAAAPAGSMSASGTDVARFMIAHLNHGRYGAAQLLRPATADLMHDSPLARVNPASLVPPLNRMELGFFETNLNGREVIGHLGDTAAFHSSLHLFMREGVGLFVSFNSPGKAAAVQPLRTAVFEDFADRYFPRVGPADGRVDANVAAQHARMMAGRWIASRRPDSSFLAAIYWLQGQAVVSVGPRGELVVPSVANAAGRPREWVEIAPFEVFDPVPAHLSAGWIVPGLLLALGVLLLTALYWPASFLVRRRFGAAPALAGRAGRVQRATRALAALAVVLVAGWIAVLTAILGSDGGDGGTDPLLWLLQLAGAVVFVGAVGVSGLNLVLTVRDGRRWPRVAWAALVFAAALLLLYVAVAFRLIAMTVHY